MEAIYLLLPVALIIVIAIIVIFFWAVKSDQFEDLEGPAHRIIMDDDDAGSAKSNDDTGKAKDNNRQP
jgi:cbb3-type cytochrome oxidase maturation protein